MIMNSRAGVLALLCMLADVSTLCAEPKRKNPPIPSSKWHIAFSLPTKERPQKMLFSPDGRSLYVLLSKQVQKWDVKTRRKLWAHKQPSDVADFALSAQGDTLALASSPRVVLCYASNGQPKASLSVKAYAVVFSRDGKWLATAGDNGHLTGTGKLPTRVAVAIWRNGSWQRDKTMLARLQNGFETLAESFYATALDFSPNSQRLVVTTALGILFEFDVMKGLIERPWDRPSSFVQFAPDGRTAIGRWENVVTSESSNYVVSLFDPKTWQPLNSPHYAPNDSISSSGAFTGANAIAYTPDSQTIAASLADGFLGLFDTKSGRLKTTLAGVRAQYGISDLAFSPNGKQLASASWNQVDFWEEKSG